MTDHEGLTVINYSGGKQSTALLWMVLRGDLPRPKHLVVLNADPGMENSQTYQHVQEMFRRCADAGIEAFTVEGPNLYQDIMDLKSIPEKTRLDNPPYWTQPRNDEQMSFPGMKVRSKPGLLRQCCTKQYKIAPMDRAIRKILDRDFGIPVNSSRIPAGFVEKWIGFSYSEVARMKPPAQKYVSFRYPLIELKMDNEAVAQYFIDHGLTIPPRSVCNACFANGVDTLKDMHDNRPEDWKQAVSVDEAVRDWRQIGVEDHVFVSKTCIPLKELADADFKLEDMDQDGWSCDSGYCFT